ncbi:MAG: hypothetical protein WD874_01860, partial [Parcubacteria group bacterium]
RRIKLKIKNIMPNRIEEILREKYGAGENEVKIRRLSEPQLAEDTKIKPLETKPPVIEPKYPDTKCLGKSSSPHGEVLFHESPITQHKKSHQFRYYRFILKSTVMGLSIIALILAIGWVGPKIFGGFSIFGASDEMSTNEVIEKVGKLVELPEGENATVATVTDLEPLKGQAFFAEAKVGDKVLIYGESKKAILYRPSENKIIVVAPLSK